jgi:putative transposase
MCSSAAWPSGSRTRWAGSGGRADRRPEGRNGVPHAVACRALGVSRSWFYKWKDRPLPPAGSLPRAAQDRGGAAVRGPPGQVRVAADHRRPARCGLAGEPEHRRRAAARAGPGRPAEEEAPVHHPAGAGRWRAPDLVKRDFPAAQLNRKWYGDGTEIPTGEGKLYLDSVLDMASRRVLGFTLGTHHDAALAYGALAMAITVRGGPVPGVIMHTDQGSEYTAQAFRQACQRLSVTQSMGRPGSALDNAVIESWHSTLEFELRRLQHFATKPAAQAKVAAWIEDYNTHRRHSSLQMMSPMQYERALQAGKAA